jgi:hypothetical protein
VEVKNDEKSLKLAAIRNQKIKAEIYSTRRPLQTYVALVHKAAEEIRVTIYQFGEEQ